MFRIYMLGEFRISNDEDTIPPFPTQKATSLTAFLINNSQQFYSREFLADMLWPNRPAQNSRRSLLTALWQIRSTLKKGGLDPDRFIKTTATKVCWQETKNDWLDVKEFEEAVKGNSVADLERAVALYQGPFIPNLYDDWCIAERNRLETSYQAALSKLIFMQIRSKHLGEAIENAQRMLRIDPLNEDAHRALIYCYYQQGNRSAALEQYRECTRLLKEELDTHPSEETMQLYRNILDEKIPRQYNKAIFETEHQNESLLIPLTFTKKPSAGKGIFTGREKEMRMLADWWENKDEICAYIKGVQGTGKTRLAVEYTGVLESQGVLVGWGRGLSSETSVPYQALSTALRGLLRKIPEPVWKKIPSWLSKELGNIFSDITEEQNIDDVMLETRIDQSHLFRAICNLIAFLAQTLALLIVIDDLQWISEPGVQLIEFIVRFLETEQNHLQNTVKLLFIGPLEMMMPIYVTKMLLRLQHDHLVLNLTVNNLDRDAVIQWIEQWSGRGGSVTAFSDLLYKQLKGNPYLVSEMVQSLFLTGGLTNGKVGWEGEIIDTKILFLPVPDSIRRQVQSEIRDLSPTAAELLNAAAVAGQSFNIMVLQKVLNLEERSLYKALDELIRSQLIRELGTGQPFDFEFSHSLIKDAAYTQISFIRRTMLHRRIAQVLEDEYGENDATRILYHYHQAHEYANTVKWALKAGQQALDHAAFKEAAELLGQAEEFFNKSKVPDETKGLVLTGLYKLYVETGNIEKINVYLERLRELAEKTGKQLWHNKLQLPTNTGNDEGAA